MSYFVFTLCIKCASSVKLRWERVHSATVKWILKLFSCLDIPFSLDSSVLWLNEVKICMHTTLIEVFIHFFLLFAFICRQLLITQTFFNVCGRFDSLRIDGTFLNSYVGYVHLTHRANNLQTRNKRRKRSRDYYKDRHCGGDKNWGKEIHHRRRAFQTFTQGKDYCSSSQCKKGGFKSFHCVSCLNIFHSYFILIFSCCRR